MPAKQSESFSARPIELIQYWVKFKGDIQPIKIQAKSWFDLIEELTVLVHKRDNSFEWMIRE